MKKPYPDISVNMLSGIDNPEKSKSRRKLLLSLTMATIVFGLGHNLPSSAYKAPTPDLLEMSVRPLTLPTSPAPKTTQLSLPDTQLEMPELKVPAWELLTMKQGESLSTLFSRAGLDPRIALPVADASQQVYPLRKLRPGDKLEVQKGTDNKLEKMRVHLSPVKTLTIQAQGDSFSAKIDEKPLETRRQRSVVSIKSSLFEDGQRAGLNDATILAAAHIFRYDMDFARDLHPGATLTLIHDARYDGNHKISDGNILAAELSLGGEAYRLMRFEYPDGSIKYIDPNGRLTERAFIRTPVAFSRISSGFTSARLHPVLGQWRAHKGVDYAAPMGTPVVATANATVTTAGQGSGYGNLIVLKFDQRISMAYGHLSRFAKGIKPGVKVKLGQTIGYVGQTGLASGPHLHYEIRVNGVAQDPLKVALPNADYLPEQARKRYRSQAAQYLALLNGKDTAPQIALR